MPELTRLLHDERSWMLFVDGENVTKRGQEILKANGVTPRPGPYWRRDVYLWLPEEEADWAFFSLRGGSWPGGGFRGPVVRRAMRTYYYTSTTSDEPEWTETRLALRNIGFEPRLFRRAGGRSKAVDVALATDVLTLAAEGRYDVAVILAGDGDYVPLVEAVKRIGLHVAVGFFETSGLSPELRIAADEFFDLTGHLVRTWKNHLRQLEHEAMIAKAKAETDESATTADG